DSAGLSQSEGRGKRLPPRSLVGALHSGGNPGRMGPTATFSAPDFPQPDGLHRLEGRSVRGAVRAFVTVLFPPAAAEHYRAGTVPLDLAPELGRLGAFGPTIQGYGCPGMGNVAAGLIMQELERGDSGLRTFASVQGSLAMMAINLFGSEEQKER